MAVIAPMMQKLNLEDLKRHSGVLQLYSRRMALSKSSNGEFLGTCPFHPDKTPSCTVSMKDRKWLYRCFGCSASGSIIDFVKNYDKIPLGAAIKKVEAELNTSWDKTKEMVDGTFQPIGKSTAKKLVIPMAKYYPLEQALANSKEAKDWLLKERGITYETAKSLHLGYRRDLGPLAGDSNDDIRSGGWIAYPFLSQNGGNLSVVGIKYRSIVRK